MPAVRRKTPASSANPRSQQKTLAFGPQNSTNKVTKSTTTASAAAKSGKKALNVTAASNSDSIPPQPEVTTVENTPSPGPEDPQNDPPLPQPTITTTRSPTRQRARAAAATAAPPSPSKPLTIRKQQQAAAPPVPTISKRPSAAPAANSKVDLANRVTDAQIRKYWTGKEDARIAPRVHQKGVSVNEKILREFDSSSQFGPCIGITRLKRWKRADGLGLHPPLEVLAVLLKEEGKGNKTAERAYMEGLLSGSRGLAGGVAGGD